MSLSLIILVSILVTLVATYLRGFTFPSYMQRLWRQLGWKKVLLGLVVSAAGTALGLYLMPWWLLAGLYIIGEVVTYWVISSEIQMEALRAQHQQALQLMQMRDRAEVESFLRKLKECKDLAKSESLRKELGL